MTIDIGLVFGALGAAKSIAEFAGILDSVESKVDRLVKSELSAGLRALDQARHATSEQVSILREARSCFNRAVGLETGYRQTVALLGLALCHRWLGERTNCTNALHEILEINPVTALKLAIAAGRGEIGEGFSVGVLKQMGQQIRTRQTNPDDVAELFRKHPMMKYGSLLFSDRARKEYRRKLALDAVSMSEEASSIRCIQESVSAYLGEPVLWLKALD